MVKKATRKPSKKARRARPSRPPLRPSLLSPLVPFDLSLPGPDQMEKWREHAELLNRAQRLTTKASPKIGSPGVWPREKIRAVARDLLRRGRDDTKSMFFDRVYATCTLGRISAPEAKRANFTTWDSLVGDIFDSSL